ncbi:hypothetical protein JXB28_02435 [Candidatus Woesearchaeota archaeon]|nr:hypothetical protein [Candidatus Woesearchaeota archaeon]
MDEPKPTVIAEKDIISTLMHKEQVQRLEHIIAIDSQRLEDLRRIFGKRLDYGPKLGLDEAKQEFPGIKKEVDAFLEVKWIRQPEVYQQGFLGTIKENKGLAYGYLHSGILACIGSFLGSNTLEYMLGTGISGEAILKGMVSLGTIALGSAGLKDTLQEHRVRTLNEASYDCLYRQIIITSTRQVPSIIKLAHEYTHHVQGVKGINLMEPKQKAFIEGHARGTTRQLALKYAMLKENPAFIHCHINLQDLAELKSAYTWVSEKLGIKAYPSIIKAKALMDAEESYRIKETKEPGQHALGNAFFYAQELVQGNSIYRDVLKGEFQVK